MPWLARIKNTGEDDYCQMASHLERRCRRKMGLPPHLTNLANLLRDFGPMSPLMRVPKTT